MGGLQAATAAARGTTSAPSGIQAGIQNAVNSAFGTAKSAAPNEGTRAPNQTPAQRSAYQAGYADNTNQGMARTAFGAVPGVGSLVGEGVARTMSSPSARNPDTAAAYNSGVTGSTDAGLSGTTRGLASAAAGLALGPIGAALASMITGGTSYAMQRAANPTAFEGTTKQSFSGPVTGSVQGATGNANNSGYAVDTSPMSSAMTAPTSFEHASDFSDAYKNFGGLI